MKLMAPACAVKLKFKPYKFTLEKECMMPWHCNHLTAATGAPLTSIPCASCVHHCRGERNMGRSYLVQIAAIRSWPPTL